MSEYQKLAQYVDEKRLSVSYYGTLELYCYTKQEFFDKDNWDNITTTHRGKLYCGDIAINNPMPKIFNVGERPETSLELITQRISNEPYEVYDKANGHLYFCSVYGRGSSMFTHTKGSLDSEMIDDDNKIFNACDYPYTISRSIRQRYGSLMNAPKNYTFMFEAIVEHDKHTLYEQMCEKYGENDFVLLGLRVEHADGTVEDVTYEKLRGFAHEIGCPVVSRETLAFDHESMKAAQGIEGYVIRFGNGDRVKIKTDDYWKLRIEKELRPEVILGKWRKGGAERVRADIPEELAEKAISVIESMAPQWLETAYIRRDSRGGYLVDAIEMKYSDMTPAEIMHKKGQFTEERAISSVSKSKAMRKEMVETLLTDDVAMTKLETVILNHLHNPEGE